GPPYHSIDVVAGPAADVMGRWHSTHRVVLRLGQHRRATAPCSMADVAFSAVNSGILFVGLSLLGVP
ncbi:MAG TPA: hypothetical protein PLV92_08715, partial [Pirellulaceae bacterium]|nr:hypothetical protein [Pirellulaceae bacterium]